MSNTSRRSVLRGVLGAGALAVAGCTDSASPNNDESDGGDGADGTENEADVDAAFEAAVEGAIHDRWLPSTVASPDEGISFVAIDYTTVRAASEALPESTAADLRTEFETYESVGLQYDRVDAGLGFGSSLVLPGPSTRTRSRAVESGQFEHYGEPSFASNGRVVTARATKPTDEFNFFDPPGAERDPAYPQVGLSSSHDADAGELTITISSIETPLERVTIRRNNDPVAVFDDPVVGASETIAVSAGDRVVVTAETEAGIEGVVLTREL